MAWTEPKTNWKVTDEITFNDFNRIKNNLEFLNEIFNSLYGQYTTNFGADMGVDQMFTAPVWNKFEDCVEHFQRSGVVITYGTRSYYKDNGPMPDYNQLNRLEKCALAYSHYDTAPASVEISDESVSDQAESYPHTNAWHYTATVLPADTFNKNVTWSSSDTSVATIDENGNVTSKKQGQTTITVTTVVGGLTDTGIFYSMMEVNDVEITGGDITIPDGETEDISSRLQTDPPNAMYIRYEYESSDTSVFTVSNTGVITAVSPGTATLTIRVYQDPDGTSTTPIKVITKTITIAEQLVPVTGVTLIPSGRVYVRSYPFPKSSAFTYYAGITPENASNKGVSWASSDTTVATINASGAVTTKKEGFTTITVTTADGGYTASGTMYSMLQIADVVLNGDIQVEANSQVNVASQLVVTPATSIYLRYEYSSSDTSKFTVNSNGIVTGVAAGSATLTINVYQDPDGTLTTPIKTITKTVTCIGQVVHVTGITFPLVKKYVTFTTSGQTFQLLPTITPVDATDKSVTWSQVGGTSNFTVDQNGLVTMTSAGTGTITATTNDGGYSASYQLFVVAYRTDSSITYGKKEYALGFLLLDTNENNACTLMSELIPRKQSSYAQVDTYYANEQRVQTDNIESNFVRNFSSAHLFSILQPVNKNEIANNTVYNISYLAVIPSATELNKTNIADVYDDAVNNPPYQYIVDNPNTIKYNGFLNNKHAIVLVWATRTQTPSKWVGFYITNSSWVISNKPAPRGGSNFPTASPVLISLAKTTKVYPNPMSDGSYVIDRTNSGTSINLNTLPVGTIVRDMLYEHYINDETSWNPGG